MTISIRRRQADRSANAIWSPPHALWHCVASIALMLLLLIAAPPARAQDGVLGRGDAVVTGFSGIRPNNAPLPPGRRWWLRQVRRWRPE